VTNPPDWSYSGDPASSDKDEVRFLLQDVDPQVPLLTDTEINYLIAEWTPRFGSNTMVASVAAAIISRKFAGVARVDADGVSVDTSSLSKTYAGVAVQLKQEYEEGADVEADIDLSSIQIPTSFDASVAPLNFSVGMHDNPYAGQQAYGGWYPLPAIDWGER
jgi:hypothetical protein